LIEGFDLFVINGEVLAILLVSLYAASPSTTAATCPA
jgi:hypothetical protein